MDLALNNLQRLICHKTQQTKPNQTYNCLLRIIIISYLKPYNCMNYQYYFGVLEIIQLCKLFVLDRNTWYHNSVQKNTF